MVMRELTKAQLIIGFLAFFSTVVLILRPSENGLTLIDVIGNFFLQLVLVLVLSYAVLALLEWIRLFELKINAVLTYLFLVTFVYLANFVNLLHADLIVWL